MLIAHNITLDRFYEPVFAPVSLQVSVGELLLITGANGSGKTTLLRILAGLVSPSEGNIERENQKIAYLGHSLAVKDDLSVQENIGFAIGFTGSSGTPVSQALAVTGLELAAAQAARTLSAGQRKRCALARLIVSPASLWILDEPYSNLDQEGMRMMDGILRTHLDDGGACIMSTHGTLRPEGFKYARCQVSAMDNAA